MPAMIMFHKLGVCFHWHDAAIITGIGLQMMGNSYLLDRKKTKKPTTANVRKSYLQQFFNKIEIKFIYGRK